MYNFSFSKNIYLFFSRKPKQLWYLIFVFNLKVLCYDCYGFFSTYLDINILQPTVTVVIKQSLIFQTNIYRVTHLQETILTLGNHPTQVCEQHRMFLLYLETRLQTSPLWLQENLPISINSSLYLAQMCKKIMLRLDKCGYRQMSHLSKHIIYVSYYFENISNLLDHMTYTMLMYNRNKHIVPLL